MIVWTSIEGSLVVYPSPLITGSMWYKFLREQKVWVQCMTPLKKELIPDEFVPLNLIIERHFFTVRKMIIARYIGKSLGE